MNKIFVFAGAVVVFVVGCKSADTTDSAATTTGTTPTKSADASTPPAAGGGATMSGAPAGAGVKPASAAYAPVQAIFTKSCVGCHGAGRAKAGIHLTDYDSVIAGGRGGPIVMAGNPDGSLLIKVLRREPVKAMPPGAPLPADQVKVVSDWIKNGAK